MLSLAKWLVRFEVWEATGNRGGYSLIAQKVRYMKRARLFLARPGNKHFNQSEVLQRLHIKRYFFQKNPSGMASFNPHRTHLT